MRTIDRQKTIWTPQDLAPALQCSYYTAQKKLERNGYQRNSAGYYSWNEQQFARVVKHLLADTTRRYRRRSGA
jgi:hypothetical protein